MQSSEHVAAKAKITDKALARLDGVDKPWEGWDLRLAIADAGRGGDVVARLADAVVERPGVDGGPGFRLGPVSLEVSWGDRLAVVGRNGSGKSTLLAALLGGLPLASGAQWVGPSVVVGEISQRRDLFVGARHPASPASTPPPASRIGPRPGRRWPSSGCRPSTSSGRPSRCHPASAPGPRWRCSRSGA